MLAERSTEGEKLLQVVHGTWDIGGSSNALEGSKPIQSKAWELHRQPRGTWDWEMEIDEKDNELRYEEDANFAPMCLSLGSWSSTADFCHHRDERGSSLSTASHRSKPSFCNSPGISYHSSARPWENPRLLCCSYKLSPTTADKTGCSVPDTIRSGSSPLSQLTHPPQPQQPFDPDPAPAMPT